MKISHGHVEGKGSRRASGTFTGTVHQHPVMEGQPAVVVNDNFFEAGARSYWHKHTGGQVLLVKAGQGHVQTRAGEGTTIREGDVIYAEPGEEHWHGARPDSYVLHTAISFGPTVWGEEVSADDYERAVRG